MKLGSRWAASALVVVAAAATGCTFNGKPLFPFGSSKSGNGNGNGGGGGDGGADGSGGSGGAGAQLPGGKGGHWCKQLDERSGDHDLALALDPAAHPGKALPAIAQALCYPRDDERKRRDELEAARTSWMKRLAMNDADWMTEGVGWANYRSSERMLFLHVYPDGDEPWSKLPPVEQWAVISAAVGATSAYEADAMRLHEAGRVAYLGECLRDADPKRAAEWAACHGDLDALDPVKLGAELRGETARSIKHRMVVRMAYAAVYDARPAHLARVKQLIASDPAYARAFAIAKAARAEWAEASPVRAELLAEAAAMDDLRASLSRTAPEGCSTRGWPRLQAAISTLPARRFEGLSSDARFYGEAVAIAMQHPDAYLAINAIFGCEGDGGSIGSFAGSLLTRWPGARGPRTSALTQIALASLAPAGGTPLAVPAFDVMRRGTNQRFRFAVGRSRSGFDARSGFEPRSHRGVIAAVEDQGDRVVVSFPRTSKVISECASRRTTNRITHIDDQGHVTYESVCTRSEQRRVDTTPAPISIPKRYAGGIAAKRFIDVSVGLPIVVRATEQSPTPLAVFGAELK